MGSKQVSERQAQRERSVQMQGGGRHRLVVANKANKDRGKIDSPILDWKLLC